MLSRSVALALVVSACVVAAGGGAYIATLQHQRGDTAMAAGQPAAIPAAAGAPTAPPSPVPGEPLANTGPTSAGQGGQPTTDWSAQAGGPDVGDRPVVPPSRTIQRPEPRQQATRPYTAEARSDARRPLPAPTAPAPAPLQESNPQQQPKAVTPPAQAQAPPPVAAPDDPPAAREQARTEPEKSWREVTVPEDSVLGLELESGLSSETARVEDRVDARVTRDVRVGGEVAIPAGSRVVGSVMAVERGGKIRERSRLGIRFNSLRLPDGTELPLNTDTVYREGQAPSASSSAKIGGGAIGGAILGTILGGGKGAIIGGGIGAAGGTAAAMAGSRRAVVLPAGTPLSIRTNAPMSVTIEK